MNAAFECLVASEFDQIRIDEVAAAAGVAKATLYRYFPSKEFLYSIVLREWVDQHHLRPTGVEGLERARTRAHAMIAAFEDDPQFFRLSVALFSSADPAVKAELSGVGARTHQYFRDDLADVTAVSPNDASIIIQAIVHSSVMSALYHGSSFLEAGRLVEQVMRLFAGDDVVASQPGVADGVVEIPTVAALPPFKQRRRQRIVDCAGVALRANPYEKLHVSTVATDADVALGTLYRYFSSKEVLCASVLREWFAASDFVTPLEHLPPEERIGARLRIAFDAFEADPEFFRVNVLLYAVDESPVRAILTEMLIRARAVMVADLVAVGMGNPFDVAKISWSLLSALTAGAISYGQTFAQARQVGEAFAAMLVASASGRDRGGADRRSGSAGLRPPRSLES
ncbi:TetR/AcrR family transcriptional regulator [Nocardia sp. NBC_01377]